MERATPVVAPPTVRPVRARVAHLGVVQKDPSATPARMPTPDELNDWMRAVATASDRLAFAALFKHFAPRLKSYLVRSGCAESLAEELTQEAMVTLWRRAASFDPARAQLSTWLYTIARNLRIDHLRRNDPGTPSAWGEEDAWDADQLPAEFDLAPEAQLLASQRERHVREALDTLPADQAHVLRLSFFEDHPHARIAEDLGIPLGTVKSRIRLAVTQLRRRLEGLAP